jgi:hypothetical protein
VGRAADEHLLTPFRASTEWRNDERTTARSRRALSRAHDATPAVWQARWFLILYCAIHNLKITRVGPSHKKTLAPRVTGQVLPSPCSAVPFTSRRGLQIARTTPRARGRLETKPARSPSPVISLRSNLHDLPSNGSKQTGPLGTWTKSRPATNAQSPYSAARGRRRPAAMVFNSMEPWARMSHSFIESSLE